MSAHNTKSVNPVFMYLEKPYIKVVPVKRLFNSTMVHEVVNRGDFFAVCLLDNSLTILPGNARDIGIGENPNG